MTGYGVAFPKQSKWLPLFNEALMSYREHGDLERLHRSGHGTWDMVLGTWHMGQMGHVNNDMTTHNMQVLVYGRLQARREEEVEQQAAGPRAVHVRLLPAGVGQYITISTISTYLQYLYLAGAVCVSPSCSSSWSTSTSSM